MCQRVPWKFTSEQASESTGVSSLCTSQDRTNARFSLQIPTEEWRYESILWEATLPLHLCDTLLLRSTTTRRRQ